MIKSVMSRIPYVVVVGTTGVGKSKFSIELAKRVNGEVINADSMQMYKGCPLITNKHPMAEREGVPHHVMDHVDWAQDYFIHRFEKEASEKIQDIVLRDKIPIIVGGTNYYLQSLLFTERVVRGDSELVSKEDYINFFSERQKLVLLSGDEMLMYKELQNIDPKIAEKFHPKDNRRVKRMLEIFYKTGEKPSEIYAKQMEGDNETRAKNDTLIYWLWSEEGVLNQRLDDRVDTMFEEGALAEIEQLYEVYRKLPQDKQNCQHGVFQAIGFKEFLPWLENRDPEAFKESVEKMKQKTRKYAKQQIKWIRKVLIKEILRNSAKDISLELDLLDASDLDRWNENVLEEGLKKYEHFQRHLGQTRLEINVPENLNATKDSQEKPGSWKQFMCPVCWDKHTNSNLILVGEDRWQDHLKGRKHHSNLNRKRKREEFEKWKEANANKQSVL